MSLVMWRTETLIASGVFDHDQVEVLTISGISEYDFDVLTIHATEHRTDHASGMIHVESIRVGDVEHLPLPRAPLSCFRPDYYPHFRVDNVRAAVPITFRLRISRIPSTGHHVSFRWTYESPPRFRDLKGSYQ